MSLSFEKEGLLEGSRNLWYALQVWSRKEATVFAHLQGFGFECLLPTYKLRRKWSDRVKELEQPLFPGYLFCRFDFQNRRPLLMAPGVLQIVGNGKLPLPVPSEEIERIQLAISSDAVRQPWPYLEIGERVRVDHGSLRGLEGILVNFRGGHRVVLSISLLQRSVAVEVDSAWVTPIEDRKPRSIAAHLAERDALLAAASC